ncbi:MAG TPA: ABC transporter permease [Candidatus Angelobacter sp.]|nr:ABC transporter permease [Candidatus Angelobacter sp.]
MKLLAYFRSLAAKFLRRPQAEDDIEEEMRAHVQNRADDLERSGLDRAEAERQAHIEFGGHGRYKEESYKALGGNFISTVGQDVRYSLRMLRKSPGFTATAVLTLAMAIGANAVVFGVLNVLILHPLHVPHPESLYAIQHSNEPSSYESYPDYLDIRDHNHTFEDLAAYGATMAGLDAGEKNPTRVWLEEASGNYFDALGIEPVLGRVFHASDEHGANSAPYIVLAYSFWHSHFDDDRNIVGRTVLLDKHPFTVIGVTPPDFHGTLMFFNPQGFIPFVDRELIDGENDLNARGKLTVFMTMGHLKPGVSQAQAVADLNSVGTWLGKTYPKDAGQRTFTLARPSLYGDYLGRPVKAFMTGLMLLAGLILLAACANLGSLFAARAADRSREVALRLAIGASRLRILRQLFTEAVLISLIGGAVGLWGSVLLLGALSRWQPIQRYPIQVDVHPDANVYVVALLLAVVSGLLFGAVPIRQVLRTDPYEVVKAGSTARVGRRLTVRDLLLVVQIALCAVLVTSSLVAVRGLARSLHGGFGFEPENAILADTDLLSGGYSRQQTPSMQKRMIDALAALPGVESVGLANGLPLGVDAGDSLVFTDKTTDLRQPNAAADPNTYSVSPEYFHAAGTALLAGRAFTWHDDQNAPRVAVINPELARRVFGSVDNAVGGYFKLPDGTRVRVVGITEQGKYASLAEAPAPAMFSSILQAPASQSYMIVRYTSESQNLVPAIRNTLRGLDSGLPFYVESWYKDLDTNLFPARMATFSLGIMGAIGAMLAVTGIFGMAAYSVSKRLKELGIRMALGAQRMEVLQAALGRAVKLLAFGCAAGLLLGLLASRVLSFIVYQATPRDPLVLAGAVLAMALLGLLATWIPAQQALSVDPVMLLREE